MKVKDIDNLIYVAREFGHATSGWLWFYFMA